MRQTLLRLLLKLLMVVGKKIWEFLRRLIGRAFMIGGALLVNLWRRWR